MPSPRARLSSALIERLSRRADVRHLPKGTVLFEEGDSADSVYVLLCGRVRVFSRGNGKREVIYNIVGPGEMLGELFLDGGPRSASVETVSEVGVLQFHGDAVLGFMDEYPEFAHALVISLIDRLRRATNQIRSLSLDGAKSRVVALVRELAVPDGDHHLLPSEITQQFIASRIGATREMVNQVMRGLMRTGHLKRDGIRGLIVVKELPRAR